MSDLKMSYRLLGLFNRAALCNLMVGEATRSLQAGQTIEKWAPGVEELVRRFGHKDRYVHDFVLEALDRPAVQTDIYEALELVQRLSATVAQQLERRKLSGLTIEEVQSLKEFETALIARWHSLLDQGAVSKPPGYKADVLRSCILRPDEISHNLRNSAALRMDVR